MKVCMHLELETKLFRSGTGIGNAVRLMRRGLEKNGVELSATASDGCDILHLNTFGVTSWRMMKSAQKNKMKVIMHAHTTPENARNSFWFTNMVSPMTTQWIRSFYNQADLVICPTGYTMADLKRNGVTTEMRVISNCIDVDMFAPTDDLSLRAGNLRDKYSLDGVVPFCVGFVIPRKGVETFVRVARHFPPTSFVWFGRIFKGALASWDADRLVKRAPKNVLFTGYVKDIAASYAAGDIFFFPSINETQGIAVLEAMAAGKAILLRDLPVFDWLTHEKDCLKAKNSDDFVMFMEELIEDDKFRRKIGRNAYEKRNSFSLERIGKQLKDTYEELLNKK